MQPLRPVWIASYPRSGNTFLRIILEKIFHLPTYSIYRVEGQDFPDPSAEALEQAPFLPRKWRRQVSDEPHLKPMLIKTHDGPEDDRAAMYIVRDGRAAIDSYFHYHKKFAFEQPSLTEIIAGACQFGSWSGHYRSWNPTHRPNTLFVKYEELVQAPDVVIPKIASFLQVQPGEGRLPTFEELNHSYPEFFRRGKNRDFLKDWTPGQLALFDQVHGPVMREIGYTAGSGVQVPGEVASELAASAARLHKQYLKELHNQGLSLAARQELTSEVDELSKQVQVKDQVLHPIIENPWVKLGMALRLVPRGHASAERQ